MKQKKVLGVDSFKNTIREGDYVVAIRYGKLVRGSVIRITPAGNPTIDLIDRTKFATGVRVTTLGTFHKVFDSNCLVK